MADLLGSLLPMDYAAPEVQETLGGVLAGDADCEKNGTRPSCKSPSTCGGWGRSI